MLNKKAESLVAAAQALAAQHRRQAVPADLFLAALDQEAPLLTSVIDDPAVRADCADRLASRANLAAGDTDQLTPWLADLSGRRDPSGGHRKSGVRQLLRALLDDPDHAMQAFLEDLAGDHPALGDQLRASLAGGGQGQRGATLAFTFENLESGVIRTLRKAWNGGIQGPVTRRVLVRTLVQQPDSVLARSLRELGFRHPLESAPVIACGPDGQLFTLDPPCLVELVDAIVRRGLEIAAERGLEKLDERSLILGLIDDAARSIGSELLLPGLDLGNLREAVESDRGVSVAELIPLGEIEDYLNSRVINQQTAVAAFARTIRRIRTGLSRSDEIAGVFLCVGPSGVGKSYLAKLISAPLYGLHPDDMTSRVVFVEGGRYKSRHEASALFGAAPGFVGMHAGVLTNGVREKGPCVIIFDEAEKMHPAIWHAMLTAINESRIHDSSGQSYSLGNCVIVLTSNEGVKLADRYLADRVGELFAGDRDEAPEGEPAPTKAIMSTDDFWNDRHHRERYTQIMLKEAEKILDSALYSRIDEKIGFNGLRTDDYAVIARMALDREIDTVFAAQGVRLFWRDPAIPQTLARMASSALKNDARYLNRLVRKCIVDDLVVSEIMQGRFTESAYEITAARPSAALIRQDPRHLVKFRLKPVADLSAFETDDRGEGEA